MDGEERILTHCPTCGQEVDKLRAGAVGIYSGKMSYFCSRACRDRFASSGRGASPVPPPRPAPREPVAPSAGPVGGINPFLAPEQPEAPRIEDAILPAAEEEPLLVAPIERPGRIFPEKSPLVRWAASAVLGGLAILALWVAAARGWLPRDPLVTLLVVAAAGLVGIVHAMLEWRSSPWRFLDEIVVVCAAGLVASAAALGQDPDGGPRMLQLAPLGILVAVWAARAMEAALTGGIEHDLEVASLHRRDAVAGLCARPGDWGLSRVARLTGALGAALSIAALPLATVVMAASWIATGRPGDPHHAAVAAAVALSLSGRLLRNMAPPVLGAALLRARRKGILFREDRAFERAGAVNAMVLRKRGVIVEPGGGVIEFHVLGELDAATLLSLVSACEEAARGSGIAHALVSHARAEGASPGDTRMVRHVPSRGIQATSPFGEIFLGNRLFHIENGISVGRGETAAIEAEKRGHTAIFVSVNRRTEAVAVISNTVRSGTRDAIARSRSLGLTTVLVTGDSQRTAESLAASLGIDHVRAEVASGSREQEIERLRDTGHRIAFLASLSDGVASAAGPWDVMVGLGWDGESQVGGSWDVAVAGEDLGRAVTALDIARRGRRFILGNAAIAVLAGGLSLGFAASGLASPVLVALAVGLAAAVMPAVRPRWKA